MLACCIAGFPTLWKMNRANRVRSLAAHQSARRDRLQCCARNLIQDPINDAAQNALREPFRPGINRCDAPKMDRYLFVVFNDLELRMIHAYSLPAPARLTKNNDALAGHDHFL